MPKFIPPTGKDHFSGLWEEKRDDGTEIITGITEVLPDEWEGYRITLRKSDEVWTRETLPEDYINDFAKLCAWEKLHLTGKSHTPILNELNTASLWVKSTYHSVDPEKEHLYKTYVVTSFMHHELDLFCAELHRAFRLAKKNNIPLKLLRAGRSMIPPTA